MLSGTEKRARLERALEYGGGSHSVEDVCNLVREGKAQIWELGDSCIVTQLYNDPRRRSVHLWTISGVKADCVALEPSICEWARSEGCSVATATGRRGWGRVAQPLGWLPHMFTFYKVLPP